MQKSASVGYCPDFLDHDIDAIIEQLTLQPPPSSTEPDPTSQKAYNSDLNSSFSNDGEGGLEFENKGLSKTIDLGSLASSLAMDEEYSSLVIPPPPEESSSVDDIAIVPAPSVQDKKKLFEKCDSVGYLKNFGNVAAIAPSVSNKDSSTSKDLTSNGEPGSDKTDQEEDSQNDSSPASVSEKLNSLLQSLSSHRQQEEEQAGHFRRTSSLRLGRCASLDFLHEPRKPEAVDKNADLVTGSVRLKPKVRPKLSIERPFQPGNGHVALPFTSGSAEKVTNGDVNHTDMKTKQAKTAPTFQRAQSCDVLPTSKNDKYFSDKSDSDTSVSESFASLKAKLQSYRDSLLNRSLRRKKKLAQSNSSDDNDTDRSSLDGDSTLQRKSSLTRSNSFSSLIRRSLGRSSGRDAKARSSSASREESKDEVTDDGKAPVRDKKYFNTLSTPRSNFRPNTSNTQSQVYSGLTPVMIIIRIILHTEIVKLAPTSSRFFL